MENRIPAEVVDISRQIKHLRTSKFGRRFVAGSLEKQIEKEEPEEINVLDKSLKSNVPEEEKDTSISDRKEDSEEETEEESVPLNIELEEMEDNGINIKVKHASED
jgi:hypothetical protein